MMKQRQTVENASGEVWYGQPQPLPEWLLRGIVKKLAEDSTRDDVTRIEMWGAPTAAAETLADSAEEDDLEAARQSNRPVSLAHAARLWRKSTHTLRDAIKAGELRAQRVIGRRYDVYPSDVDAWIRGKRVETAAERARRHVREGR